MNLDDNCSCSLCRATRDVESAAKVSLQQHKNYCTFARSLKIAWDSACLGDGTTYRARSETHKLLSSLVSSIISTIEKTSGEDLTAEYVGHKAS